MQLLSMKKLVASIIFIVTTSHFLFAQEQNIQVSGDIKVSANIVSSIDLITVQSMTFGNVQPGQQELYVNPINSINAGFMIATGNPEAAFRLTYLPEIVLTQVDGTSTLTFMYEISGNSIENQSTSELLDTENRSIQFSLEGRYYFWIGGRINITNAVPGNYEGDFTIEIDYI